MKIVYLANISFPSPRAHAIQAMEMCNAFARQGHQLILVAQDFGEDRKSIFKYYNLDANENLLLDSVNSPRSFFGSRLPFAFSAMLFMIYSWIHIVRLYRDADIIYAKDEKCLYLLSFFFSNIVWEPHVGYLNFFSRGLSGRISAIIALTGGVKEAFVKQGIDDQKILVAHDAIRLSMFTNKIDIHHTKKDLNLPSDKFLVMYVGHLFDWKGVHVLAEAMSQLSEEYFCVFVGGAPNDVQYFREKYKNNKNILILGNQSRENIPKYLQVADVLVLPNSGKFEISRTYTSPLKLFEYMASKKPIIASRLPSLLEVLNDQNATLVQPDDHKDLVRAIKEIRQGSSEVGRKINCAYNDVSKNTWENRASNILTFAKKSL